MAGRQICQWDKDSCDDAGFLKIDLLGLGMLSAVEDCVEQIARLRAEPIDLSRIPLDDQEVYGEIRQADTVGVFQIESRAQMQMLLRTRPENLDDLTIEVALVRPGPIQGGAVHPYIAHREALRRDPSFVPPVDHPLLAEPLRDTLGVVVFQDQVLAVAMALAGFTVGEAEALRRAMSRKRSAEALEALRERFVEGALRNGVDEETAHRVYDKLAAFSGFGFPKSHSVAFALLAYQSAWLRRYYPAEFLCALMNAQPMGFYPPATLVRDGQRRGVEVIPPDVNTSDARCVIRDGVVVVGLGYVRTVSEADAQTVVDERERAGRFADVRDLAQRAPLQGDRLSAIVAAGACDSFGRPRRELLWELGLVPRGASVAGSGGEQRQLALPLEPTAATPELPEQTVWERMLAEYGGTTLSIGVHPLELLRPHLPPGTAGSRDLPDAAQPLARHGRRHGRRAPAPVDRERRRLHAARGRARPHQPDRPAAGLRAAPRDRPRRAARPRPRHVRARRPQPEHRRVAARDARPAGAADLAGRRAWQRPCSGRAPLRVSLGDPNG